jgi:hypothetical protein
MLAVLGAAHTRADVINGSFETTVPAVAPGSFVNFFTSSAGITGWVVVGPEVSVVRTLSQGCCSFPAQDGSNWLDLTGDNSNSDTEGVKQTVSTVVGDQYSLSFSVGNVFDPTGLFGTTSAVNVSENGTTLGTFTNSCTSCTTQLEWQPFTTTFVATSTSTTLQFLNADPSIDNSNGLDKVALVDNGPSAVPEPSSLISMFLFSGLWVLASFLRRRGA